MDILQPHNVSELQWLFILLFGSLIVYFLKKRDKAFDEHERALRENTFALVKLSLQMELVLKELSKIPEMEKDLNNIGEKVRSITQ